MFSYLDDQELLSPRLISISANHDIIDNYSLLKHVKRYKLLFFFDKNVSRYRLPTSTQRKIPIFININESNVKQATPIFRIINSVVMDKLTHYTNRTITTKPLSQNFWVNYGSLVVMYPPFYSI